MRTIYLAGPAAIVASVKAQCDLWTHSRNAELSAAAHEKRSIEEGNADPRSCNYSVVAIDILDDFSVSIDFIGELADRSEPS